MSSTRAPVDNRHDDRGEQAVSTISPASSGDAFPVLAALVVVLLAVPSALILKPLGAAGTPANILADALVLWWLATRVMTTSTAKQKLSPAHVVIGIFVFAMLLSYVHGVLRPITHDELSSADRGLLTLAGWAGLVLGVADGIRSRRNLDRLLRLLMIGAAAVAFVGILQFFTGRNLADYVQIPGLIANHPFGEAGSRSSFRRVTATTLHPIEFGVVLASVLPIALHFAFTSTRLKERRVAQVCVGLMLVALPMTVARSAMLGMIVAIVMIVPTWNRRQKVRALFVAPFAAVLMKLAIPGLLGTIKSLFLHAGSDPSVQNRLGDYTAAGYYISHSFLVGRGFFTLLPNMYRTYDNEYIGVLIESGIVGFAALLLVMGGPIASAIGIRRSTPDAATRSLAYALATTLAVSLITYFTFDAFAFPMSTSIMFITIGAIGALWRLQSDARPSSIPARVRTGARRRAATPSRLRERLAVTCIVAIAVVGAFAWIHASKPQYQAVGSMLLGGKPDKGQNPYQHNANLDNFTVILERSVTSDTARNDIAAAGHNRNYTVAIGDGSLEPYTDQFGTGSLLRVASTAATPSSAVSDVAAVMSYTEDRLATWQRQAGVPSYALIQVQVAFVPSAASPMGGSQKRAYLAAVGLAVLMWLGLDRTIRPSSRSRGKRRAAPSAPGANSAKSARRRRYGRVGRRSASAQAVRLAPAWRWTALAVGVALVSGCTTTRARTTAARSSVPAIDGRAFSSARADQRVDCASTPSSCGYPDASNTGVRTKVSLKRSGWLTISQPGAVVSGLDIVGGVKITAPDVTLEDCRIEATGPVAVSVRATDGNGVTGVVIEHVEIDGGKRSPSVVGVLGSGFTVESANIHGTGDAVDAGDNVIVKDSWIHDLWVAPKDHTDGVQVTGAFNVSVTHNTIDATGANSAIIFGADLREMDHTVAADNLLDGGAYTIYAGSGGKYDSGSITVTNNRFGSHAKYGPYSFKPSPGHPIAFSGNVIDATGANLTLK